MIAIWEGGPATDDPTGAGSIGLAPAVVAIPPSASMAAAITPAVRRFVNGRVMSCLLAPDRVAGVSPIDLVVAKIMGRRWTGCHGRPVVNVVACE